MGALHTATVKRRGFFQRVSSLGVRFTLLFNSSWYSVSYAAAPAVSSPSADLVRPEVRPALDQTARSADHD